MIREIKLKFGRNPKEKPLIFDPGPITVFVGPNNSGKSLILREIEEYAETGMINSAKIIDHLDFNLPDTLECKRLL